MRPAARLLTAPFAHPAGCPQPLAAACRCSFYRRSLDCASSSTAGRYEGRIVLAKLYMVHAPLRAPSSTAFRPLAAPPAPPARRLPEDVDISLTFGCKEPLSGQHLKLEGIGAFDAAVHCASVAAAERHAKYKRHASASQLPNPEPGRTGEAGAPSASAPQLDIPVPAAPAAGGAAGRAPSASRAAALEAMQSQARGSSSAGRGRATRIPAAPAAPLAPAIGGGVYRTQSQPLPREAGPSTSARPTVRRPSGGAAENKAPTASTVGAPRVTPTRARAPAGAAPSPYPTHLRSSEPSLLPGAVSSAPVSSSAAASSSTVAPRPAVMQRSSPFAAASNSAAGASPAPRLSSSGRSDSGKSASLAGRFASSLRSISKKMARSFSLGGSKGRE